MKKAKLAYLISTVAITSILISLSILKLTSYDLNNFSDLRYDFDFSEILYYLIKPLFISGFIALILYSLTEGYKNSVTCFIDSISKNKRILLISFIVLIFFVIGFYCKFKFSYIDVEDFFILLLITPFASVALTFLIILPLVQFISSCKSYRKWKLNKEDSSPIID